MTEQAARAAGSDDNLNPYKSSFWNQGFGYDNAVPFDFSTAEFPSSSSLPSLSASSWPSSWESSNTTSSNDYFQGITLDMPPQQPLFLKNNDYPSKASLEFIQERMEAFCNELKVSFEFTNIGTYAYKCKYDGSTEECDFQISLFTAIDGGYIIHIERWSQNRLAFLHIHDAFRNWLQMNHLVSNPNHIEEKMEQAFYASIESEEKMEQAFEAAVESEEKMEQAFEAAVDLEEERLRKEYEEAYLPADEEPRFIEDQKIDQPDILNVPSLNVPGRTDENIVERVRQIESEVGRMLVNVPGRIRCRLGKKETKRKRKQITKIKGKTVKKKGKKTGKKNGKKQRVSKTK